MNNLMGEFDELNKLDPEYLAIKKQRSITAVLAALALLFLGGLILLWALSDKVIKAI